MYSPLYLIEYEAIGPAQRWVLILDSYFVVHYFLNCLMTFSMKEAMACCEVVLFLW